MDKLAPICLFTYNRIEETKLTVQSLQHNFWAKESDLIIFSDGPKNEDNVEKVDAVRRYLKTITGFNSVTINESQINKGLAASIIGGVSLTLKNRGSAIVVEDDLILSSNFLIYMNQCLVEYKSHDKIFSVSGFCYKISPPKGYMEDVFFYGRANSWGWGTWIDRWETIDWEFRDWENLINDKNKIKRFNKFGTDLFSMLKKAKEGKVNSWFIRFAYNQFSQNRLTVYPFLSKVINNGFSSDATHCDEYNRYEINFDKKLSKEFNFSKKFIIIPEIRKQLFHYKSYSFRIIRKFLTILMRNGIIKQKIQK